MRSPWLSRRGSPLRVRHHSPGWAPQVGQGARRASGRLIAASRLRRCLRGEARSRPRGRPRAPRPTTHSADPDGYQRARSRSGFDMARPARRRKGGRASAALHDQPVGDKTPLPGDRPPPTPAESGHGGAGGSGRPRDCGTSGLARHGTVGTQAGGFQTNSSAAPLALEVSDDRADAKVERGLQTHRRLSGEDWRLSHFRPLR
jgi:hypothetical protein